MVRNFSEVVQNKGRVLICTALLFVVMGDCSRANAADLISKIGGETLDDAIKKLNAEVSTTLKQFLDQAEAISDELLNKGKNAGSLLTIQAANEMALTISTARNQFANEANTQVASVSTELKPFLVHLQRWEDSINKIKDSAVELEDLVALDLQNLSPFNYPLQVRRLQGGVFVENDADSYTLDVTGSGFGFDPAGVQTTFLAKLGDLQLASPDRSQTYHAIFKLDPQALKTLFAKTKLVTMPFELQVNRTEPGSLWNFFRPRKTHVEVKFTASLLPEYAGEATVTTSFTNFSWSSLTGPTTDPQKAQGATTPVHIHVDSPPGDGSKPQPGNKRIVPESLKYICLSDFQPAHVFSNGQTMLDSDTIFSTGFVSTDWVGGGGDQTASYNAINHEFDVKFGFSVNNLGGRCAENDHCKLLPAELLAHSKPATMDVSGCPGSHVDKTTIVFSHQNSQIDLDIKSNPETDGNSKLTFYLLHPQKPPGANWLFTYQIETYTPDTDLGKQIQKSVTVYSSPDKPFEFDVMKHFSDGPTSIEFHPTVGRLTTAFVPNDVIPESFKFVQQSQLLDRVHYVYQFKYKTR